MRSDSTPGTVPGRQRGRAAGGMRSSWEQGFPETGEQHLHPERILRLRQQSPLDLLL